MGAMTENGLITLTSAHDVETTVNRLTSILESKGVAVLARYDHAAETSAFDRPLRPTTVVMFGNPAAGLPLIRIAQTVALDLPLKAMVWEDAKSVVRFSYVDPAWIASRHHIGSQGAQSIRALSTAMANLARQVTGAIPKPELREPSATTLAGGQGDERWVATMTLPVKEHA
jgi:uncharacterized protein (DUF302 family)